MDYLYHYTKLNTLELILKSKKLRFSSLLGVDDVLEGKAQDIEDIGKYVFVSCFTYDEKESIPIWSMYGNNGDGVRIKMNTFPFKDFEQVTPGTNFSCGYDKLNRYINLFINEPYIIEYVSKDEMEKICPKVVKPKDIDIGKIGTIKIDDWKFQKEVRFIMLIFPISKDDMYSMYLNIQKNNFALDTGFELDEQKKEIIRNLDPFSKMINNMKESIDLPIKYYDMPLKDEVINNLEITLGYGVKKTDKHKIHKIVKEFNNLNNAHITIKNSELQVRSNG